MDSLTPLFTSALFIITTAVTLFLFIRALNTSNIGNKKIRVLLITCAWLILQAILSGSEFYLNNVSNTPPLFPILGFFPLFILMIILFNTSWGKSFIDSLSLERLTWISIVRIPVEIVLWQLFIAQMIPEIMTFEGQNFDILAGISAPIVAFLAFRKASVSRRLLLGWNILSLLLLLNIVITAMLSFPTNFQLLSFDLPNTGILYFPFFWLPSFVVPVVMFSHFVSIRRLLLNKQ